MNLEDYSKPDFDSLFEAEEKHFWFRYRNNLIGKTIKGLIGSQKKPRILELGCGNGNVLREIEKRLPDSTLVGSELFEEGLSRAKGRVRCELRQADIYNLPEWPAFDLIGLFDVLEHLPDDVAALKEIRKSLRPGGKLLITVPASMSLWSYVDVVAGHYRRYTCKTLKNALLEAGFQVPRNEPVMMPLYPAMWLSRKIGHFKKNMGFSKKNGDRHLANQELRISPLMNYLMGFVLNIECGLLNLGLRMPFGTSILAVGENPIEEKSALNLRNAG